MRAAAGRYVAGGEVRDQSQGSHYQGLCLLRSPPVRLEGRDEGLDTVPRLLCDGPQLRSRVIHRVQQPLQLLQCTARQGKVGKMHMHVTDG